MRDPILECVPEWRYCRIERGSKAPRYQRWPQLHYQLADIPPDSNIGVLLGPASGGLLAIDFDGESAFGWWHQNIPYPLAEIDTPTWQGRQGRCQMVFRVLPQLWDLVPSKFAITTGEGEQLEWRWSDGTVGIQSVVPPSVHPATQQPYQWLREPGSVEVQMLPDEVLAWACEYRQPRPQQYTLAVDKTAQEHLDECNLYLKLVKRRYPQLNYEEWMRVAWGVADKIGADSAAAIMNQYWREQRRGEYSQLLRTFRHGGGITFGTVVHMAGGRSAPYHDTVSARQQLHEFEQQLREKYNLDKEKP